MQLFTVEIELIEPIYFTYLLTYYLPCFDFLKKYLFQQVKKKTYFFYSLSIAFSTLYLVQWYNFAPLPQNKKKTTIKK